jgi:NAD(P)-dependent dehydrogenase (short-subunit alcohol dehydrogenase family)
VSPLFDIRGKTALVTGGTSGIGLMIARGFVEAGARVYVASRKADACKATQSELSKLGECIAIPANLSTHEGCVALASELREREDRLHILVNNAGSNWGEPFETFPPAAWDRVLDLNVKSPFFLVQELAPLLEEAWREGDPGRIINIGSVDGLHVPPLDTYSYSTSKAAIHQLTRILARKLAPKVTVNAVAPGPFESKMMAVTLDNFRDSITAACPLGRIGEPDDMVGITIFLSSRAGAYLTGTIIPVDGGMVTTL